ncbi:hypothetical protein [Bacillus sp. FJAT-27445]|uniref:hypothetical protein n=1 Tax=Bacillus sp. FJAT-27445 TaxID=1679166 RepID=UPI0007443DB8|nr:hypothetical protein [Bacillus sp. FJAT-27445]
MKANDELTQEVKQLLSPIKNHPSLEPRQQFVYELQNKIKDTQSANKRGFSLKPVAAFCIAALLFTIVFLSTNNLPDLELAGEAEKPFAIKEESNLKLLQTIKYGDGEGEAGLKFIGENQTLPITVTSFDVEDGAFYLLDEAKRQVLIVGKNGVTGSFPIKGNNHTTGTLKDILVTSDKQIYILNTWDPFVVYQYTEKGTLVKTHKITADLFHPDELVYFKNRGVFVSQSQERFLNLETGEMVEGNSLPYHLATIHRKEAVLTINEDGHQTKLTIPYQEGKGQSAVESLREGQIIFTKTEQPAVYKPLSETHVFAYNKQGGTLGGIRLPIEKLLEVPQTIESNIKADKNRIYFLSPEKEHLAIYELTLGEKYESFIQKQAEEAKVGYDYKTFGRPFPELEQELKKLFTSGTIFSEYGDENSVNGAAIDDSGTVVIDFKEFHAGGPSSHQAGEIGKALNEAIFQKFPEVQTVYLQFDGSFSAWCIWMQSTEEPWVRP